VLARTQRGLAARLERDGDDPAAAALEAAYRDLRRDLIAVQGAELRRMYEGHEISDTTRRRLQHDLDREEAALGDR
jgi:CPA1 family monovalent cation:H+ antiporter